MGKESQKKKDKRHLAKNLADSEKACCNCGKPGKHFVPPSFGEKGFFACEELAKKVEDTILGGGIKPNPTLQEYLDYKFKIDDEGFVRVIRRNCFNGNGLLMPVCYDDLEDAYRMGQKSNHKVLESLLTELEWARMTVKDKLKFGMDEEQAIKSRERRCNGVLIKAIRKVKGMLNEEV